LRRRASRQLQFLKCQNIRTFESTVGTFWIRKERDGGWCLSIADDDEVEPLGYYKSRFDAADDVCTRNTGLGMWDKRAERKAPASLFEWTKKVVR
jgi:hypothetical protein